MQGVAVRYPTAIVGLQEIPKWKVARASGFMIRSSPQSDCGLAIPIKFNQHIGQESWGDYWYGVAVGDLVCISIHIIDYTAGGSGEVALRESAKFISESSKYLRERGHSPWVYVAVDANTTPIPDVESVTGNCVMAALQSHYPSSRAIFTSWLVRQGLYLPCTFNDTALSLDDMWTRRGSVRTSSSSGQIAKTTHSQIDFGCVSACMRATSYVWTYPPPALTRSDHRPKVTVVERHPLPT